jgi:ribonuclease HI
MPLFDPVLGRIRDKRRLHNIAWQASHEWLRHEHRERKRRIYKIITNNKRRRFAARVLPYTTGKGLDDIEAFRAEGHLSSGNTAIYYSDGSHRNHREQDDGALSAAVAYYEGESWETEKAFLPRYSGDTKDAELYGIKMAFDLAILHATNDHQAFDNIVIFTDCQDLVQMLAGEDIKTRSLGPVTSSEKWAIEDIYDAAEELERLEKNVVVAWIKGHNAGPATEGNRKADRAANSAISSYIKSADFWDPCEFELPAWVGTLAGDVYEEALWRLSKPFFRWGSGNCWIAPTLLEGNGTREYEEEEDWTVYRPVMTLEEAQEEDAQELRQYLAEKKCKERGLPIKEDTSADGWKKAEPLKHVYHQAEVLPHQTKTVDYSKIYRKVLDMHVENS